MIIKKISFVLADDGFTEEVGELEYKAIEAQLETGVDRFNRIYIPAGLTRLHLLALCSMTHLPIYMGNCDGQPFSVNNQSYEHTLNGNYTTCPTEKGIIEAMEIFDNADYWTEDGEQMMSVEEVLYAAFVDREDSFSPDSWCPKNNVVINCRGGEALVYYPGTGWEIKGENIDGERGLKRNFIPI